MTSLWYKSRDISIKSVVPFFVLNLDPSNSIAILLFYYCLLYTSDAADE